MNRKPWDVLETEMVASLGFGALRKDLCVAPGAMEPYPYFVLEVGPWVNVVAFTAKGELIVVDQYRHGAGVFTREIPAGGQRRGETGEQAARRELLEETGFVSETLVELGSWYCNPALQTNRLSTFLATGCVFDKLTHVEVGEEVACELIPMEVWSQPGFVAGFDHYFSSNALRLALERLRDGQDRALAVASL
jgi:8-oxo-dGTP pyrophosphatase MutT (NUDIX family)